jgi:hypothetical protein
MINNTWYKESFPSEFKFEKPYPTTREIDVILRGDIHFDALVHKNALVCLEKIENIEDTDEEVQEIDEEVQETDEEVLRKAKIVQTYSKFKKDLAESCTEKVQEAVRQLENNNGYNLVIKLWDSSEYWFVKWSNQLRVIQEHVQKYKDSRWRIYEGCNMENNSRRVHISNQKRIAI